MMADHNNATDDRTVDKGSSSTPLDEPYYYFEVHVYSDTLCWRTSSVRHYVKHDYSVHMESKSKLNEQTPPKKSLCTSKNKRHPARGSQWLWLIFLK